MRRFARNYDRFALDVLAPRARLMRRSPTHAEAILWRAVRGKQLGFRFRRQVILGPYVVDFFVPESKLVVEVDGPIHNERREEDQRRDNTLRALGYQILRFENARIIHELPIVLSEIKKANSACSP